MADLLTETSGKLKRIIDDALAAFSTISEKEWAAKPYVEKWSKKQTLGHLIDSAVNNHLRFVNAQFAGDIYAGNTYEQDFFVSSQKYAEANTEDLISLWYAYNRHLAAVIRHVNSDKLNVSCHIGSYQPVAFSFVITDYVSHLEHHLEQILK